MTIAELKKSILDYLLCVPNIDKAMNDVLALVGNYFHVDRAYIFESAADGLSCSNTYEWCRDGIEPQIERLQSVRYKEDLDGFWQDNFDANGLFLCLHPESLPARQRDILLPQGITGMLQYAIRVHDEYKGFVGFDNCSGRRQAWETDQDAIDALSYTAHILSLYLLGNRHSEEQLAKNEEKMSVALQKANKYRTEALVYKQLSEQDKLTKLDNRRSFDSLLEKMEQGSIRYTNAALLFMDLNYLKKANDTLGHAQGDQLLIRASECIKKAYGMSGYCYRIGGDEFCTVIINPSYDEEELLSRILSEVERENACGSGLIPLSIACGCSFIGTAGERKSISAWKSEADAKMYANKNEIKRRSEPDESCIAAESGR